MKTLLQLKIELIKSIINYPFLYRSSDWILEILTMDEKYNNVCVIDEWQMQGMRNDGVAIYRLVNCYYIPRDMSEVLLDYEERGQTQNSKV